MSQSILEPSVIAKEALFQVKNNLVMGAAVHRDYKKEFKKIGDTVTIRKPVKFTVTDGVTRTNQDVLEGSTSITINKRKHVSWQFSSADLTLSIEEYSERYIKPAAIVLANQVDQDLFALYDKIPNWVGTPGQTINSFADLSKGPERLDLLAVPADMRYCALSPSDYWGMVSNLTGLTLSDSANSPQSDAYRNARLGRVANMDVFMGQNVQTHTVGAHGTTPLVDGASQTTTYSNVLTSYQQSLVTDGWTASKTLKAGDVFTIDSVYDVNPISKATLTHLKQFTLVSDVTTNATTTNDTTLTITPPIITSGAYQTVSAAPADDATITYLGTAATGYAQNMAFHKNAFALVMIPLEMPDGASWKQRMTHENMSIRLIKYYVGDDDVEVIRVDILYGVEAIYPELAVRLSGTA